MIMFWGFSFLFLLSFRVLSSPEADSGGRKRERESEREERRITVIGV
jgi:hypothetical protein